MNVEVTIIDTDGNEINDDWMSKTELYGMDIKSWNLVILISNIFKCRVTICEPYLFSYEKWIEMLNENQELTFQENSIFVSKDDDFIIRIMQSGKGEEIDTSIEIPFSYIKEKLEYILKYARNHQLLN